MATDCELIIHYFAFIHKCVQGSKDLKPHDSRRQPQHKEQGKFGKPFSFETDKQKQNNSQNHQFITSSTTSSLSMTAVISSFTHKNFLI